jgi:hypothetical protein
MRHPKSHNAKSGQGHILDMVSIRERPAEIEDRDRGRLDASRMTPVANARRDLFEAMKQVAETGLGPADQTASMGCSIKWKG